MRGTEVVQVTFTIAGRIIPAYAGNRFLRRPDVAHGPDHPRVCGEQDPLFQPSVLPSGSSPRMRGTGPVAERDAIDVRIIPAYAGNSREGPGETEIRADHPRVCGEQRDTSFPFSSSAGSSPRMRGTG